MVGETAAAASQLRPDATKTGANSSSINERLTVIEFILCEWALTGSVLSLSMHPESDDPIDHAIVFTQGDTGGMMFAELDRGDEFPFYSVADISVGEAFSSITRQDRRRSVSVSADANPDLVEPAAIVREIRQDFAPGLESRHTGVSFALEGASQSQKEFLANLALASLAAFFLICILILIDFINKARAEGVPAYQAVVNSGKERFRPIVLTSLTTAVGLMPIVLETSMQARMLIPMAISLSFGIVFATVISLFLISSPYLLREDFFIRARDTKNLLLGREADTDNVLGQ